MKRNKVETFRLKQRQILTSFKCLNRRHFIWIMRVIYFACDEAELTKIRSKANINKLLTEEQGGLEGFFTANILCLM